MDLVTVAQENSNQTAIVSFGLGSSFQGAGSPQKPNSRNLRFVFGFSVFSIFLSDFFFFLMVACVRKLDLVTFALRVAKDRHWILNTSQRVLTLTFPDNYYFRLYLYGCACVMLDNYIHRYFGLGSYQRKVKGLLKKCKFFQVLIGVYG